MFFKAAILRILGLWSLLLAINSCAPVAPPLQLPEHCSAVFLKQQLLDRHWLCHPGTWRLRQGALLEIGSRKLPMEGLLLLDLGRQEARLLAMNEMGMVLFDLQVSPENQQMLRTIPPLQKIPGLAEGVAQSLREIYLQPRPEASDQLETSGNSQTLWRPLGDGLLEFLFDCQGDLRQTRLQAETGDWRVVYDQYRNVGDSRLPGKLVLNDFRHRVKLTLWLQEVRQQP